MVALTVIYKLNTFRIFDSGENHVKNERNERKSLTTNKHTSSKYFQMVSIKLLDFGLWKNKHKITQLSLCEVHYCIVKMQQN